MKTIRIYFKISSFILLVLTLTQSCVVYRQSPVSLEQAVQEETRTRILMKDGKVEKFKRITQEDEQYNGIRMTGKGPVTVPIDINSIDEIRVKNKGASIFVTVLPFAALTALAIAGSNMSFGGFY
mgnify:CR=1 FL=1